MKFNLIAKRACYVEFVIDSLLEITRNTLTLLHISWIIVYCV